MGGPKKRIGAIAAGFQLHLPKPTLPDQLVAAAGRLTRERTAPAPATGDNRARHLR